MPAKRRLAFGATAVLCACGTDSAQLGGDSDIVTETIGDTTVVRTVSGSVWGAFATLVPEISVGELDGPEEYLFGNVYGIAVDDDGRLFVLDGQAQIIRVYGPNGTYVETLARRGEGPGELNNAMSVAVLPDGRVLAHEPVDGLVKVVGPEPADRDQWAYPPGAIVLPVKPLRIDRDGRVLVTAAGSAPSGQVDQYVIVMGPDGELLDSLAPPGVRFEPPSLERRFPFPAPVPFTARHYWTTLPSGHFATGISSVYRVHLHRDDGVLRIERSWEPVPISEAERGYHRERVTRSVRRTQPDWNWNGPPIPESKPPFRAVVAGRDGRIWVQLWSEARPVANLDHDPQNPRSEPVSWESPVRYDVFEPDGTYLGVVATPEGFLVSPSEPIFDGDVVWAVTRDDLDVQRVVRYRIELGGPEDPTGRR